MAGKPHIVILSGSLRAGSSTHLVIGQAIELAGERAACTLYEGTGRLPHFDDNPQPAQEVLEFRELLRQADGVLICTPEYAFGVPGTLKNALDWTVSSGELVGKPVALITAATGGDKAHAALSLTLRALSANMPDDSMLLIPFIRARLDAAGKVKDAGTLRAMERTVNSLLQTINEPAGEQ